MDDLRCRYIFVRMSTSMAQGLRAREAEYGPVFANSEYGIWRIKFPESAAQPSRD